MSSSEVAQARALELFLALAAYNIKAGIEQRRERVVYRRSIDLDGDV